MVGKRGLLAVPVVVIVIAIIVFFSWFFWPTSVDDSEKEDTTIKGNNNKYQSSQSNDREYSVVHLENADAVHGWMFTLAFLLMFVAGTGAVCHQKRVATPHRERLEEGVAELRGVLIDRGYIQGRKKRRLSRKQKKVAKKVKKLQEKLKKNDLDVSVSEEEV